MQKGTVKCFYSDRGFGFIQDTTGTDVFIHARVVAECGIADLKAGDTVYFEAAVQRDGRLRAIRVEMA